MNCSNHVCQNYLRVKIEKPLQLLLRMGGAEKALDHGPGNLHHAACQMVTQLLTKALGNRFVCFPILSWNRYIELCQ